jgi:SAM-dependent methyltransferase
MRSKREWDSQSAQTGVTEPSAGTGDMTESDRMRWDRKYTAGEGPAHFEPNPFLAEHRQLLTGEQALDLACGFGGNALYLASLGYRVDAVDVSSVALQRAQAEATRRGLSIHWVQADLKRWWIPAAHYDLILILFYLDRSLMRQVALALRPGGLLYQANRNKRFLAVRPDFDPDYLLELGELWSMARDAGLEILHYGEVPPEGAHDSQLIARRPTRVRPGAFFAPWPRGRGRVPSIHGSAATPRDCPVPGRNGR